MEFGHPEKRMGRTVWTCLLRAKEVLAAILCFPRYRKRWDSDRVTGICQAPDSWHPGIAKCFVRWLSTDQSALVISDPRLLIGPIHSRLKLKKGVRLQAFPPSLWVAGELGIGTIGMNEFLVVLVTGAPCNAGEARVLGLVDPTPLSITRHKMGPVKQAHWQFHRVPEAVMHSGIEDMHRGFHRI